MEQVADSAPLSFAQQRLWLLDRLLPLGSLYNVGCALRLVGAVNVDALHWAVNEIVRRHEVLRTRFGTKKGEPLQVIAPLLEVALEPEDLRAVPVAEREGEARRRAQAEAAAPFDLERGPLLRVRLLQLEEREHWLLMTLHHIVTDGWSTGVLMRELGVLYTARCRGDDSPLPELPVQYADYAVWQRNWLQSGVLQQQLAYWKPVLADLPVLELPTDRPRPRVASYRGGRVSFEIGEDLTRELKALGRVHGATLFMTLLAAFQVLLHRYSGQDDIAVGAPIAGRVRPELAGLIGFFVNTLVLRGDLSGEPSFSEYLARVCKRALDAYAHQDLPFEKLVEELHPKRDLSRNPLFQVSLAMNNTPRADMQAEGLVVRRVEGVSGESAKWDLLLSVAEVGGKLRSHMDYAKDLFDATTIERLVGHWRVLLESIVADPERRISRLPLLTPEERRQLLVEWNNTAREYPRDRCLHALFEAQAARAPEAVAVVAGAQRLSYRELNARANRLAHHLRTFGVGPDVLVGLCLEPSLELVVAMLGVLKAGGAYVPLDPSYPAERLAFMLADTQAPVVLTHQRLAGQVPAHAGRTLCLDRDLPAIAKQADTNPPGTATAENLAYVIYTSGSTGNPKGVMIAHRAVNRLVCNTDYVRIGAEDRIAQASNTSFDAATFEVWGALLNGARLVVLPKQIVLHAEKLAEAIAAEGITTLFLTTALFNRLAHASVPPFAALTNLLFGGEASDAGIVRQVLAGKRPSRLLHVYGPTETTTFATYHEVSIASASAPHVPIGLPIGNTSAHVLDRFGELLPVGIPGELYVGGDGVARGYLRRPELTAERFVPDPYSKNAGHRLYKTGDLVRRLPDGNIEFLGRIDEQVKIRGFRVEPGELEAILASHPGVAACAVTVRRDSSGENSLVAYFVPREEPQPAAEDLRAFLKTRLPDFMLPAALVPLREIPVSPNGKLDRARLPDPGHREEVGNAPAHPRSQLEMHLMKLWERLLGVKFVGTHDNFFDLGGHSLLAVRLVDEIERRFGRRIPLDAFWYHGATVAHIADLLQQDEVAIAWPLLVRIKPAGSKPPLFCIHTMGGNLFHYDQLAHALDADQPIFGLQARGVYGREAPRRSLGEIAADCIAAMKTQQPRGPYMIAGYSSGGWIAFEMVRQLVANGENVALLALLDSFAPNAKRRRRRWQMPLDALRRAGLRGIQERTYHAILSPLGLSRFRVLKRIGEAQRWAFWSYRAQPYGGVAHLLRAEESSGTAADPALGWAPLVLGGVRIHQIGGNHSSIMKPPQVVQLAAILQSLLDTCSERQRRDCEATVE